MSDLFALVNIFSLLYDPFVPTWKKVAIILTPFILAIILILIVTSLRKENFIGTDIWHGYNFHDSNKTSKKDRTDSLVKISKGWLPGERPKDNLLENFENVKNNYNPRTYEISPDYHRTVKQFGIDPNPAESLETPEFMIPKTYRGTDKYEALTEVNDNAIGAMRIKQLESSFKNVEKNKYYADLLESKCRAGNRSSYKNCGCKGPAFGEF